GKFINQFKLEEARKMLESNAYQTVGEVSRAVGFKKQDHFSKIYKELFGTSPSAYFNPTNDP
ncbi:MAG: helix-turn-helix domain-containing protein, partial [Ekhidna sp.]